MIPELLKKRAYEHACRAVHLAYHHIKDNLPVEESLSDDLVVTSNTVAILAAALIYITVGSPTEMPLPAPCAQNGGKPISKPVISGP